MTKETFYLDLEKALNEGSALRQPQEYARIHELTVPFVSAVLNHLVDAGMIDSNPDNHVEYWLVDSAKIPEPDKMDEIAKPPQKPKKSDLPHNPVTVIPVTTPMGDDMQLSTPPTESPSEEEVKKNVRGVDPKAKHTYWGRNTPEWEDRQRAARKKPKH